MLDEPEQPNDFDFNADFLSHLAFEPLRSGFSQFRSAARNDPEIVAFSLLQKQAIFMHGNAGHAIVENLFSLVASEHQPSLSARAEIEAQISTHFQP
jgi:hypothetical protein